MDSMIHGTEVTMIKPIGLIMMLIGQETTIIIKCTLPGKQRNFPSPFYKRLVSISS